YKLVSQSSKRRECYSFGTCPGGRGRTLELNLVLYLVTISLRTRRRQLKQPVDASKRRPGMNIIKGPTNCNRNSNSRQKFEGLRWLLQDCNGPWSPANAPDAFSSRFFPRFDKTR